MTTSSKQAFQQIKKNSDTHEAQILSVIRGLADKGATKRELEIALSMKHQTVTARLSSLRDKGMIYLKEDEDPKDGCSNWYATPVHLIEQYARKQKDAKFVKWINSGKKRFGLSKELAGAIATEYNDKNFH